MSKSVLSIGAVRVPWLAVSMHVARNLPKAVQALAEDLKAAHDAESEGGTRVTHEEVTAIAAHVFERLAEGALPLFLRANGL